MIGVFPQCLMEYNLISLMANATLMYFTKSLTIYILFKVLSSLHKTDGICHVYCNFSPCFTYQTNVTLEQRGMEVFEFIV